MKQVAPAQVDLTKVSIEAHAAEMVSSKRTRTVMTEIQTATMDAQTPVNLSMDSFVPLPNPPYVINLIAEMAIMIQEKHAMTVISFLVMDVQIFVRPNRIAETV